jgi:hypothetical protein
LAERHQFVALIDDSTSNGSHDGLTFPGELSADSEALPKCLSPILSGMKIFGAYFSHDAHSSNGKKSSAKSINKQRVYCIVILVFLWLNAIRSWIIFDSGDSFSVHFIIKLPMVAAISLTTISHTSYFIASHSGRLDDVIRKTRITPECETYFRKLMTPLSGCHVEEFYSDENTDQLES